MSRDADFTAQYHFCGQRACFKKPRSEKPNIKAAGLTLRCLRGGFLYALTQTNLSLDF
jgi:hypothetical protein